MRLMILILALVMSAGAVASPKSELKKRGKTMDKEFQGFEKRLDSIGATSKSCMVGAVFASDNATIISLGAKAKLTPIKVGDTVTLYNGRPTQDYLRLTRSGEISLQKVGDEVSWTVNRGGQSISYSFNCPLSRGEMLQESRAHIKLMKSGKGEECAESAGALIYKYGRDRFKSMDYYLCSSEEYRQWNNGALFNVATDTLNWAKHDEASFDTAKSDVIHWIDHFEQSRATRYASELSVELRDAERFVDGESSVPAPSGISQGSCFFASGDGTVVTNHHVVEGKSNFTVIDVDGQQFTGTLMGGDPSNDLAVLKVNTRNHASVTLAPFGSLKTGQDIFAVGYPVSSVLGTEPKFTDGVVSATTGMQGMANMFQMTVPIQPGNSGGPVLNEKGQVVGVATSSAAVGAFLRNTGTLPQNVNWAIKSEYVSLLAGVEPSKASWGSRQDAIDAAIGASCMVKAK